MAPAAIRVTPRSHVNNEIILGGSHGEGAGLAAIEGPVLEGVGADGDLRGTSDVHGQARDLAGRHAAGGGGGRGGVVGERGGFGWCRMGALGRTQCACMWEEVGCVTWMVAGRRR